jgi:hypothetical protein
MDTLPAPAIEERLYLLRIEEEARAINGTETERCRSGCREREGFFARVLAREEADQV